jgi:hypothetical protein
MCSQSFILDLPLAASWSNYCQYFYFSFFLSFNQLIRLSVSVKKYDDVFGTKQYAIVMSILDLKCGSIIGKVLLLDGCILYS